MSPALHPGLSNSWRFPPVLSSDTLGCLFFIWMFRHSVFWFITLFLTQSVRLPLVTYLSLCSVYVTYITPCHASGHQGLPTQPLPRQAEDFPRGANNSKHMPQLMYLVWLQPICYNPRFVFMHAKTLIKNIEQQPH